MLLGKTLNVRLKDEKLEQAYPWRGATVPVNLIGVYPYFLVGTVLPHRNPKGYGESHPYNITISRQDLIAKRIIITGGAG